MSSQSTWIFWISKMLLKKKAKKYKNCMINNEYTWYGICMSLISIIKYFHRNEISINSMYKYYVCIPTAKLCLNYIKIL